MGGMPMQFVKSSAVYVSCVAGAVSFNESAATPHMTKGSPAEVLLTHDTIMRSGKPGLIDRWPCAQRYSVQGGVRPGVTRLQRRSAQRLHFIARCYYFITAKVSEYKGVAAVEQAEAKPPAAAGPRGRCSDRPPLRGAVRQTAQKSYGRRGILHAHARHAPECKWRSIP